MEKIGSLQSARTHLIGWVQEQFKKIGLSGIVVFDGSYRVDEEGSISHTSPLAIAYTAKGQTADNYIVEKVQHFKNPRNTVVVTNDKALQSHCKSVGSNTMGTAPFLQWIRKKSRQKGKVTKEIVLSKREIDLMVKIFEDRLLKGDE